MSPRPGQPINPPDYTPGAVILAVALLALVFLGGFLYLRHNLPDAGIEIDGPKEIPPVTATLTDYRGTLWGLERARQKMQSELRRQGITPGRVITVYANGPKHLRPIAVQCRTGYELPAGTAAAPGERRLTPGRRLAVRVPGKGDFTGMKAFRQAERKGFQPEDGERYEVRVNVGGKEYVEHWITVKQ